MTSSDDIEREIMLEMEKEISRSTMNHQFAPIPGVDINPTGSNVPPFGTDHINNLSRYSAGFSLSDIGDKSKDTFLQHNALPHIIRTGSPNHSAADLHFAQKAQSDPYYSEPGRNDTSPHQQKQLKQENLYADFDAAALKQEIEQAARREVEEEARREAQAQARREAEEQARREAEEQARREAEEQARREAEEEAHREAEEEARREAEEQARREAEEEARREAEELARREAEEEARREAEEEAHREAEEQARREAEEEARREAEELARREAEEQARREAEEEARREAEELAQREAEAQARREAEEEARREAEELARREAEEEARREAEEQARREAEEEARREAEEQARREAEELARREAEEQARREAEEEAHREAEAQARREAEEQAQREAEEQARREAEEEARREAEEEARREAEELARREAEELARREAEEEARREAEELAQREAEAQARREAEEEARREAEELARREAEELARREAEAQAQREAEEQARREAEELARREAEEQARREAEAKAHQERLERIRQETRQRILQEYALKKSTSAELSSSRANGNSIVKESRENLGVDSLKAQDSATSNRAIANEAAATYHKDSTTSIYEKKAKSSEFNSHGAQSSTINSLAKNTTADLPSPFDSQVRNDDDSPKKDIPVQTKSKGKSLSLHSSDSNNEDDSSEFYAASALSSHLPVGILNAVRNRNGILDFHDHGPLTNSFAAIENRTELLDKTFTETASANGAMGVEDQPRNRILINTYETIREPGKCLFPPDEMHETLPPHIRIQLGFFSSQQAIISYAHASQHRVADRERLPDSNTRSLSTLQCYFENDILKDQNLTVDDEGYPHNAPSERLLSQEELEDYETAVDRAVSKISYGDPLQVWEKAQGKFDADHSKNDHTGAESKHHHHHHHHHPHQQSTLENVWVNDIDTKKPVSPLKTFTGGSLLCVKLEKITNPVMEIHGSGTDPLIVCAALYSDREQQRLRISEYFYFGSGVDIFYPHKIQGKLALENRAVVFVPNEFKDSLKIVVRIFRPCSEDFDTYLDLYMRADRYKQQHVAPMKQEILQLAMTSEVLEEMGWCSFQFHLTDREKKTLRVSKIFNRLMEEAELLKASSDERAQGQMWSVPFELELSINDLTGYEVSFPTDFAYPHPQENQTKVCLLNPDVKDASPVVYRYVPCCIPILNSGYFTSYNNVFYFRLSHIKVLYSGPIRNCPSSHRTFVLQICVKDRDDTFAEEGLRVIYGRGLSPLTMETSTWSSSVHAASDFDLNDEIKIQLPLNLTDRHHIFLTLYASHQKKSSPIPTQPRLIKVGYAAFPLLQNGALPVSDKHNIKFVIAEKATIVGAGGYLEKFATAPNDTMLNNGEPVLKASTQARTSVYASNKTVARIFQTIPSTLPIICRNDDCLKVSGHLHEIRSESREIQRSVIVMISELPLPEILAFYPLFCSYALALIASPSQDVSLSSRMHMLDVLIGMTARAQQYDVSTRTTHRRHGSGMTSALASRTSASSVLYHFLTNDLLYEGSQCHHKFRLYAGLTEVWLNLLNVSERSSPTRRSTTQTREESRGSPENSRTARKSVSGPGRNLERELCEYSWFLFDAILRSIYLWAHDNPDTKPEDLFDPGFYKLIGELCLKLLTKFSFIEEGTTVRRIAIFVRNLMHHCDRIRVLHIYDVIVERLKEQARYPSLCQFIRIILEDASIVQVLIPAENTSSSSFLSEILIKLFSSVLTHELREIRLLSTDILYDFLCRLANDPRVPAERLMSIAEQLFTLTHTIGINWKSYSKMQAESKSGEKDLLRAVAEKRKLSMIILWITFYTPRHRFKKWLQNTQDLAEIKGFFSMISDIQFLFHHNQLTEGFDKDVTPEMLHLKNEWSARNSTFVTAIGVQLCHIALRYIPSVLRTIKNDQLSPVAYNFFLMLESVLSLNNSTISLQMSAAVLYETVCVLFPEIISRKARTCNGVVLLALRLMSSCCQYVRSSAGAAFLLMSKSVYNWSRSLARIKLLTTNALVAVAESKTRDLRFSGRFIEFQFDELIERAKVDQEHFKLPQDDYLLRFDDDSHDSRGDSGSVYQYKIPELFLSVHRELPISQYLLEKKPNQSDTKIPAFSDEFASTVTIGLKLFDDVLRLKVDHSMQYKEAKIFAYFDVLRNFLRQNALKEVLKWLHRLHEAHKANEDYAEAGLVLVFIAALCFRVTEVFYLLKGKDCRGARMPYAIFSHVFWQDYVRILPEVDALISPDIACAVAQDLFVCPEDECFTLEEQLKTLKDAAECLDKGHYYEFSVATIAIADTYIRAMGDFHGASLIHNAMTTWCSAIATKSRRETNRYFFLWARMEREEPPQNRKEILPEDDLMHNERPRGLPNGMSVKRVYKMPPNTRLDGFQAYATAYVKSLFSDPSLVVTTEDLTDTLPAFPTPDSKKKRVAASTRQPNHCLLTVFEVQPRVNSDFPMIPEGLDKTMHINEFECVMHRSEKDPSMSSPDKKIEVLNHRMTIGIYKLDRSFPSTTTAIDIISTNEVLLDPYQSAIEVIRHRHDLIAHAPDGNSFLSFVRQALSPLGTPTGMYLKAVVKAMGTVPAVVNIVQLLCNTTREKLQTWEKKRTITTNEMEDYAMVWKTIADVECALIATQEKE